MTTLADIIARAPIDPGQATHLIGGICEQLQPVQLAMKVRYYLTPETITVDDTTMAITLADRIAPHCEFRAPETWPDGTHRNGAPEVYALGAMLTLLISGEWPPAGLVWMDPDLRDLAGRMLSADPAGRPTLTEISHALNTMSNKENT